jgi:catechol 2,3-dioxygenase-like lactoylglutathione lyase family enzyme
MKRTVDFYSGVLGMPLTKTINAPDQIDDLQRKLAAAGIDCTPVVNHDDSEAGASMTLTDSPFVRSVYFQDPDGILLEFAAWTRELDERDVNCEPRSADRAVSAG